jgi:predicted nucleotidyltransferase
MSLVGSLLFNQINRKMTKNDFFEKIQDLYILVPSFAVDSLHVFDMVKFKSVNIKQIIGTGILGFSLSLLMFLVCVCIIFD